ncbi:Nucleoside-diphosphate-sugar epimerase [Syntrophus gentianae]|uniref:Nucleoside-diphosphate-sugar epimerase n=1 Tax=Syntrophus gentianae TaxID=43775 RepID=A0A1H7Z9H4_9BACT|nr:NAD-dependent epimerase/dehydratase family protein [Syntrophus gentianae]SEM54915.1 Nucleoside-diphosphate-sugar epimerase [Syntrophus gentianae]
MYKPPNSEQVRVDIEEILKADLPWKSLSGKRVLVTGASGMLAAYVVETLLLLTEYFDCVPPVVTALVRNRDKAEKRFSRYLNSPNFKISSEDICRSLEAEDYPGIGVIIHGASIPRPDGKSPVEVMAPNILGTWNLLNLARELPGFEQFLYFSSGIVNGENIKSDLPISEDMFFPSSCTGPTACYTESKRAGEAICLAFMRQYGIPVKLLRYFGSYGPGMDLYNDQRAFTSFVKNAVNGEDIVLLSSGEETRFWCYITDATEAFFRVFFSSVSGEAWNIANNEAGCTIREFAQTACELSPNGKSSVRIDPSKIPSGYTPFQSQQITVPDITKLRSMGFMPKVPVREGLRRTIKAYLK